MKLENIYVSLRISSDNFRLFGFMMHLFVMLKLKQCILLRHQLIWCLYFDAVNFSNLWGPFHFLVKLFYVNVFPVLPTVRLLLPFVIPLRKFVSSAAKSVYALRISVFIFRNSWIVYFYSVMLALTIEQIYGVVLLSKNVSLVHLNITTYKSTN